MNTISTTFRRATIRCSYDALAYDISNYAYTVGDAMQDDTTSHSPHATHLVQDVMEGQNRDRINRVLDNAYHRLCGLFMPFLCQEDSLHDASNDSGRRPVFHGYTWHLKIPTSITSAHIDRWGTEVYEYMVAAALADWFEVCAPSMAQVWKSRRDTDWTFLAESVKLHNRRARISLSPF